MVNTGTGVATAGPGIATTRPDVVTAGRGIDPRYRKSQIYLISWMQKEGAMQKAKDKKEAEALAEGSRIVANQSWIEALSKEIGERADS